MIRYRRPKQDDVVIFDLIERQLVPLSHLPQTEITKIKKDLPRRLGHGITLVTCPDYESDPNGFVHFLLHGDLLYIDMLAIAPDARRKHLGNMLMDRAERFALSRGCHRSKVSVDLGNAAALAFYRKLGYSVARYQSLSFCYELEKRFS
ncbi:N-acetyltransferase [Paenibacillus sp. VTT E-133280]|jgi:ribosomal protein S18 acetylase RimI-like enzyme|uniref:GNAT family N-acetyltransferase n=1 Tax=Paenibacillus odorifer TaxID=189426 RepID=A0A1R0XWC7_9BACL|nr:MULTISPECIES: GNAT family N-acetyltransferase [Paenibacillus]AIQ22548.1 GCN5 family acetyltransferase [Paenibacillus sp. FSL H7-0737]AIQ34347.1 GCN5 family acetyltransferase [Paenibacillus sp. FSL R5-0345]KAA1187411.1 GNAT family N-acetyltransferase [Paenibacillus sp. B2(2019)]MDH6374200.1 ribosomal protein S18 acetylase RimI-like enzyme [Paenibacillus sp. PastF-3]OMD39297.1 GNAT family N-acetyltransferase [Paenibacillus odorifer]